MIYIAFRMAAVHLEKLFRIDCFLPFKLRLLLPFAAINAKYINFETQRAIGMLKQKSKEIFLMSWLTVNAKLKTSGNFVELEGSQTQNNY